MFILKIELDRIELLVKCTKTNIGYSYSCEHRSVGKQKQKDIFGKNCSKHPLQARPAVWRPSLDEILSPSITMIDKADRNKRAVCTRPNLGEEKNLPIGEPVSIFLPGKGKNAAFRPFCFSLFFFPKKSFLSHVCACARRWRTMKRR